MKRLLIIGASILQLPGIKKAKEMGMYVGVVDYNPRAVGIPYADEFFEVSTVDIEGVIKVAEEFKPDGIFTLATDMPMRSIAAACEKLGLPGISLETAIKSTNKGEMIKTFENNKIAHPWYVLLANTDDIKKKRQKIKYPCICKPVESSGSRGVVVINNEKELLKSCNYSFSYAKGHGIIIEELLKGNEVSVEIIAIDGQVYVLQVTDKITTGSPHFVEMGHSQPSCLPETDIVKIQILAEQAVKAVGIQNGAAHVEIMNTSDGPKMIELGARMGGDCITTHLVPLSTGIDMIELAIKISCGVKPKLPCKEKRGAAIKYISCNSGIIKTIEGVERAKRIEGIKQVEILKKIGDTVPELENSVDRIGFVIAQGKDVANAITACDKALQEIKINVL